MRRCNSFEAAGVSKEDAGDALSSKAGISGEKSWMVTAGSIAREAWEVEDASCCCATCASEGSASVIGRRVHPESCSAFSE